MFWGKKSSLRSRRRRKRLSRSSKCKMPKKKNFLMNKGPKSKKYKMQWTYSKENKSKSKSTFCILRSSRSNLANMTMTPNNKFHKSTKKPTQSSKVFSKRISNLMKSSTSPLEEKLSSPSPVYSTARVKKNKKILQKNKPNQDFKDQGLDKAAQFQNQTIKKRHQRKKP